MFFSRFLYVFLVRGFLYSWVMMGSYVLGDLGVAFQLPTRPACRICLCVRTCKTWPRPFPQWFVSLLSMNFFSLVGFWLWCHFILLDAPVSWMIRLEGARWAVSNLEVFHVLRNNISSKLSCGSEPSTLLVFFLECFPHICVMKKCKDAQKF